VPQAATARDGGRREGQRRARETDQTHFRQLDGTTLYGSPSMPTSANPFNRAKRSRIINWRSR